MGGTSALCICAFCYMWNVYGVAVFHTNIVNCRGIHLPESMCILLYVNHILCSDIPSIYSQFEWRATSAISICALCYMWNLFGVVLLHRSMVNWRRGDLGTCAFCYRWNFFSVVIFHAYMVNWRGVLLPSVYVHSAIYETILV